MTHPFRQAARCATAVSLTVLGAACAVFFSLPDRADAALAVESLPITDVVVVAVEQQTWGHDALPRALAVVSAPTPAPAAPLPAEIATTVVRQTVATTDAAQASMGSRLVIPSIKVDAAIREMGYTTAGAMEVPDNRFDVSWFEPGTVPGETGSAVMAGHNRWDQGIGVFDRLDELQVGDLVSVVSGEGLASSFVVTGTRTYAVTDDGNDIFDSATGAHLNLITCSGVWNSALQDYTTRLVVFTDAVVI